MTARAMTVLLPLVLLASGCATASTVADCATLAGDVAQIGLSGVPTREQAEEAVQRLDERVSSLEEGEVRDAAAELRDRLRVLQEAARAGDVAAAAQAAERARAAAGDVADTCGLPAERFLG